MSKLYDIGIGANFLDMTLKAEAKRTILLHQNYKFLWPKNPTQ